MTDLEKAAEIFFDRWMPIYGMVVCIACFLFLIALAVGAVSGLVMRAIA